VRLVTSPQGGTSTTRASSGPRGRSFVLSGQVVRLVPVLALALGCGQPKYECGADFACVSACVICDTRQGDGGCGAQSIVDDAVSVCGPVEAENATACGAVVGAIVDAGASPCARRSELALRAGGLDVISCALSPRDGGPVLRGVDEPVCRRNRVVEF
jgi:hypothetical protein